MYSCLSHVDTLGSQCQRGKPRTAALSSSQDINDSITRKTVEPVRLKDMTASLTIKQETYTATTYYDRSTEQKKVGTY